MAQESTIEIYQNRSVITVALNRPDSHNALTAPMLLELTDAFRNLATRSEIRIVILTGKGRSFCAGADLSMMRAEGEANFEANVESSGIIFDLLESVNSCPFPVIGRINGSAFGGGVGLMACCDIVVAIDQARFAFSEVRLGLIPAVIAPFVISKIGPTHARELFLTGERFDASHAKRIGLIHHVVPERELDATVSERVEQLLLGGPKAQREAKRLIRVITAAENEVWRQLTTEAIAARRGSAEGREGMNAFLEKRKPSWQDLNYD